VRRHLLPIVLAGLVLAAGCSTSDDDPQAESETTTTTSTASTSVSPTATATPADPFAIPEVIDAAYVDRVLAELYRIDGDVVRKILATNTIGVEDARTLRAIYADPQVERAAMSLARVLGVDKKNFKSPPGDRRVRVQRIIDADNTCILSIVKSDFSNVVNVPPETSPNESDLITLRPTAQGADPDQANASGWSISNEEVITNDEEIEDRARCDG